MSHKSETWFLGKVGQTIKRIHNGSHDKVKVKDDAFACFLFDTQEVYGSKYDNL